MNSNTRVGCERCSRLIRMTLAKRKSIAVIHLLGFTKQYTLFECFNRFCPLWYWQYFNADSLIFVMQPTMSLQRAAAKAREAPFCRKKKGTIIYSCIFWPSLHSGNNFSSGYLTFDIFNSMNFLKKYRKQTKSNYTFTYADSNISSLILGTTSSPL